jgi:hypothetical protein
MTTQTPCCDTNCNCPIPPAEYVEDISCGSCAPKLALTPEEEAILSQMRSIKSAARPIAARLKNIEQSLAYPVGAFSLGQDPEWVELNNELSRLRIVWREWEARLEDAIERKLILLGHRPPR